jgi:signal peptide peptidase SppA
VAVRVVDVFGLLSDSPDGWTRYSDLITEIEDAVTDPSVGAVLLRIDSPGGDTTNAFEAADAIAEMSKIKPIWSVVDGGAYSAAYLIASQTSRIFVQPKTGGVGSIGVYCAHIDFSGALSKMGVKVTFVSKGDGKVDGNPYEPLSESALSQLSALVAKDYGYFADAVERGRGLSKKEISGLGARLYFGADAIEKGLATDAGGMREALSALGSYLASGRRNSSAKRSANNQEVTMAEENGNQNTAQAEQNAQPVAEGLRAQLRAEVAAEVQEIADLCELAGTPERASKFIAKGASVADVRKALLADRAKKDEKAGEVVSKIDAGAGASGEAKPARALKDVMAEMVKR